MAGISRQLRSRESASAPESSLLLACVLLPWLRPPLPLLSLPLPLPSLPLLLLALLPLPLPALL